MEGFNFYRDNVAYLYRHFDDFKNKAQYFLCPLPFEVKYEITASRKGKPLQALRLVKEPISLGALFLSWKQYPELFRIESDGKTGMIYAFNGSPLSGQNVWNAVDTDSGETFSGSNAPLFRDRCTCLNDAVIQCEEAVREHLKRKGMDSLDPATLPEVVEFVRSLEK